MIVLVKQRIAMIVILSCQDHYLFWLCYMVFSFYYGSSSLSGLVSNWLLFYLWLVEYHPMAFLRCVWFVSFCRSFAFKFGLLCTYSICGGQTHYMWSFPTISYSVPNFLFSSLIQLCSFIFLRSLLSQIRNVAF